MAVKSRLGRYSETVRFTTAKPCLSKRWLDVGAAICTGVSAKVSAGAGPKAMRPVRLPGQSSR